MKVTRSALGFLLAAALIGVAGCGSGGGTTAEAPATSDSASETAQPSPGGVSTSAEPGAGETSDAAEEATDGASAEPTGEAPAEDIVITIRNFEYELPESVPPGAEITVVNEDTAPHTVTTTESDDFDAIAQGGETVTFTAPEEPGEYPFFCTYHPNMTGTLVVSSDG
ncbi:hypothetical protein GC088_11965 [Arthrobacter sp. JZ12]|uniref:cupredoxin domain-containing protein n=1 Tax=Arthrobacter sp. JZ12 TaxID=2654190 RepID=UPI002B4A824F|nr:cupredoxin domain-containing protein [Arthrobacter sp. JZ12]WRH25715.1 hypothetical protein GC088_11965 [Arthrobacter sp. JZ12]